MTTALMPEGRQKFFDNSGRPLSGGKVYTYAAGTTTPKATYQDSAGTTPHANPIVLDSKGEATIYWDGAYKVDVQTSAGVSISGYPVDNYKTDPAGIWNILTTLLASAGSSLIGFIQSGAGAVARTVQDKLRDTIHAKDFGVDTTGATDAAAKLQAALDACANGKFLKITGSIKLNSRVVVPAGCAGIIGDGIGRTTITFTREQSGEDQAENSAIVAIGVHGATYRDFTIQYTGTFNNPGSSYWGVVNGLYIVSCDDVLVERVEATAFNMAGIRLGGSALTFAKRNTIKDCYLHHNRVAGCLYEYQQFFCVTGNRLEYNGYVDDGGTGYGITAATSDTSKDILIDGNFTNHNYRKGIDFHGSWNAVVTNNICRGDRLVGIFFENTSNEMSGIVIADNYIEVDPDFYVSPTGGVYDYYRGISVYIVGNGATIKENVSVRGNFVKNLYKNTAAITDIIGIYVNTQTGQRSEIDVSNNQIRGASCLAAIGVESATANTEINANITGNLISVGALGAYAIYVTPSGTGVIGACKIKDNNITAVSSVQAVITVKTGLKSAQVSDNTAFVATLTTAMVEVQTTATGEVIIEDNAVTCTTGHSNSKFIYNKSAVTYCSANTYQGQEQGSMNRLDSIGGAHKVWRGRKSLSASALTDVIRIGQEYTQGFYKVKWCAWYNTTAPGTATAGGEFTFVAGWSDNGQTTISTFNTVAAQAANNGIPDISLTWAVDVDITDDFIRKLQVTANIDCDLYFEVEAVMAMDKTVSSKYALM